MTTLLQLDTYNPNHLLDTVIKHLGLRNDASLSRRLALAPPVISKIRGKTLPIGASLLINLHEETGLEIIELRQLMGDTRRSFNAND